MLRVYTRCTYGSHIQYFVYVVTYTIHVIFCLVFIACCYCVVGSIGKVSIYTFPDYAQRVYKHTKTHQASRKYL